MQELAAKIRDDLDRLAEEYERLLLEIPGYPGMAQQARSEAARNAVQLVATGLEAGDQDMFVQFVQAVAVERAAQGLEIDSIQQALTALVEVVEPLLDTVEAASFLWKAVIQVNTTLSQMAMERARSTEERFKFLADNITVGVFVHQDGILRYVGREGARILGYDDPAQVVGRSILDFVHPSEQKRIADLARRRVAGEPVPDQYESRFITRDGSPVDVHLYNTLIEYEGRVATQGAFVDITARKEANERARRAQEALRAIVDSMPFGVIVIGRDKIVRRANQAALELIGCESQEQIVGKICHETLCPAEVDRCPILDLGQELDRSERVLVTREGERVSILKSVVPVTLDGEEALLETFVDITERKQAEQSVAEQQAFLQRVIDADPNFIFVKDRESRFVLVNQAVADAYGSTPEELIGKSDADFNPNREQVENFHRDDLRVIDDQQEKYIPEEPITTASGKVRWLQTIKRPLVDEDGVARRLLGVSTDITERKRLEQRIQGSLDRRGRQVQTSTEVAQEIAAATELEELFRRVVTLIKERFDYYHAQIFRYEPALDAVLLVVGYGETGERMLVAGHRLELGRGVVGTAAFTGQSVLASDVAQDPDWVPNPFLPDSQGELAVPIKWRDEVLGILDVQSETAGALTEEDQLLLEGLCGQIAIAIQDTRLRLEMEENLRELERLTRASIREGWEISRRESGAVGYRFDGASVVPTDDSWTRGPQAGGRPTVATPLAVRGEVIGALGVQDDPRHPLSHEDLALVELVAEQVAQALESARLFEQTQVALDQTDVLYRVGQALNVAASYDQIVEALKLHPIVHQASRGGMGLFNRPWSAATAGSPSGDSVPEWVDMVASWHAPDQQALASVGTRYELEAFPVARHFRPDEPFIVEDIADDPRLDDNMRQLYLGLFQARGTIFVPLVAGEQWIGWLNVLMNEPGAFPEDQVRSLMTLAGQAAVALRNLSHLEEIRTRALHEQSLREIAALIAASQDLVMSLPAITQHLRQLVPLDVLTLATYTPGDQEYVLFAPSTGADTEADDFALPGTYLPVEGTCPGWVITHREPWLDADIRREMLFLEDEQLVSEGMISRLSLPLLVGERVVGAINLGSKQPGVFTTEQLPLLHQVADQMALALERTRLLQETRNALAEAEATHRAYLQRGWRDYLRQQEALRRGAFLYDRTQGAAVLDGLTEPVADLWLPEMERALAQGLPTVADIGGGEEKRTGLAIPIVLRGQTIGVLGMDDPAGEHAWSEEDRAVIEAVGRQLAQALENARLLGETQLRAQRERIIGDITSRVRASMDLDNILRTTVRELGAALGTDRAFIRLNPDAQLPEKP